MNADRALWGNSMRLLGLAAAAVLLALSACGEPSAEAREGGTHLWSVAEAPSLVIGASEEETELLYRVAGATRLPNGDVVVANSGSSELKTFRADGSYRQTFGGAGDGPGEMRGIMQLIPLSPDSLLVLSFRPGLTWFGADGDLLDSERVDLRSVGSAHCRIGEGNLYALADGSLLTILEDNFYGTDCPPTPPSPWRTSGLVGRQDPRTGRFDTLAIMPANERNSPNFRVYGKTLVLGLGPDRIYAADTGAEDILVFSLEGEALDTIPSPFEPRPVPESAKADSKRPDWTAPDGTVRPGSPYLYPEHYPRIARLLVARTGELWVMQYPEIHEPISSHSFTRRALPGIDARWRTLSPQGEVLGEVVTPAGFFPLEVGEDYILGVTRNELDVETVELYELSR